MHDLSRRLGYRKGMSTPAYAGLNNRFRRYLRTYGLVYREEIGPTNAYEHLRTLISSPDCSHPLVSVPLGFAAASDASTEIIGVPSDEDHVIVILEVDDINVEYFDATAQPALHGEAGTTERAPVDAFLRFWSENQPEPFLRGWVEKVSPLPEERKQKVKPPRRTLYAYETEGGAR